MFVYSLFICNRVIRIESEHGKFLRFCRGYIIQEPAPEPDYTITVSKAEIIAQQSMSSAYGMDMQEGFVILRKLAEYLLEEDRTIFMHGSVVAYNDSAYMFTAESGVGKTTHSRLWVSNLDGAYILNGDKPFISTGDRITAWGSPWCGSERYNRNNGVQLKAICLLQRAEKNSISEISFAEALPILARQTGDLNTGQSSTRIHILEALYSIGQKVKVYRFLMNNLADDAFATSYQVLSKIV